MAHRRPGSPSGSDPLELLLTSWQKALIDLGFRNRLVSYRRSSAQAGMDLLTPGVSAIIDGLPRGCVFAPMSDRKPRAAVTELVVPAPPTPPTSLAGGRPIDTPASRAGVGAIGQRVALTTSKSAQIEQDRHLRRLATVAKEKFNDYGLWVLHLGVGFLDWRPAASAEGVITSPLVLVPVTLRKWRGDSYLLELNSDEEASFNPALAIKMEELGVAWPRPEQVDLTGVPSLLAEVRREVAAREGWQVRDRIVLDAFNSSKEVMYRDLKDNAARIMKSNLVRAVGLGGSSRLPAATFDFPPVPLDRIDQLQPPEQAPLVLDADASQRQCVAAAMDGRSFVMDGPPGTGKSQTITNMIAGLLEQGRSVLFVSEKAAALDVVRNRLKDVGLDDYVLALHSNTVGRKQVAQELGRALEAPRRAFPPGQRGELATAKELREELSGYAAAMNEQRRGLNGSLHAVLGRIALLNTVYQLRPEPAFDAPGLTEEGLARILSAAGWVSHSWRPAVEGNAFAWRDLTGAGGELDALDRAVEEFDGIRRSLEPHAPLIEAMGWEGLHDIDRLIRALRAGGHRPALPLAWLSRDFAALVSEVEAFELRLSRAEVAEQQAVAVLGSRWAELSELSTREDEAYGTAPTPSVPPGLDLSKVTAEVAASTAAVLAADADALDQAVQLMSSAARMYGVPAPVTCEDGLRLARLAQFSAVPAERKPPGDWLTREGVERARNALDRLSDAVDEVKAARTKARQHFTDLVLTEDSIDDVAQRFATVHRSFARRLSSSCRADRRLVRTLLPEGGKCTKAVIAALPGAVAWKTAQQKLDKAAGREGAALGHLWQGENTGFEAAQEIIGQAEQILVLAPLVTNPEALRRELAYGADPRAAASSAAAQAAEVLVRWRDSLVLPPSFGTPQVLEDEPLAEAARWSRDQLPALRAAEQLLLKVGQTSGRTGWTMQATLAALDVVRAAQAADGEFRARAEEDWRLLDTLYADRRTDRDGLRAAVDWLGELRRTCGLTVGQVFPTESARRLHEAAPDSVLEEARDGWERACTRLTGLFRKEREEQLRPLLDRALASAEALLQKLDGDRGGPDEWSAYLRGRRVLDTVHLGDLVVRAVKAGVAPDDFPSVVEKAVLRSWVDRVIQNDPRLLWNRSQDRDDKVVRFRNVDRALTDHARARVARACDARRPAVLSDSATRLLNTEGKKKSRHKPVHTLLKEAGGAVRLVKPCFMMSPLMVSRFLPPDFTFDVVIFDEASQVLPQDAVNCIYRGRALIVAGDENQLPPTAFFTAAEDGEDDDGLHGDEEDRPRYESLLTLAKGSGMLKSLSLRWHYRSRHEHLIAFSNREFYDGSMTTFPGALSDSPDVGVAFVRAVDGRYRSGAGARDNPLEAREVARRVIHHFDTRRGRSLGVVALSQAQAEAVREAVDDARRLRPDLDEHFSEDRLDGFFVKNLETVQGDERDVIIMSVGYGRDMDGKFSRNFGPMNRAGGWRRLNVAVTRARYRVEVVASFDPDELTETGSDSFRFFARYLKYAKHGPTVLAQEPEVAEALPESPFEESVLEVLRGWGYTVQPQVGVAGYRIDMGVRDPRKPGRYALGIECDGAMYHSSKAARDRDRLRESVLNGLGWNLHRIWGTDWYRNRAGAEARLKAAVEREVGRPDELHEAFRLPEPRSEQQPSPLPPAAAAAAVTSAEDRPVRVSEAGRTRTDRRSVLSGPVGRRIDHELTQIRAELERPSPADHTSRPRARAEHDRKERERNADLSSRADVLRAYLTGDRVAAAAAVCPGRLVTLRFEGEDEEQEYEITSQRPFEEGVTHLSPFTALGRALTGRGSGAAVEYEEQGRRLRVHVCRVRD